MHNKEQIDNIWRTVLSNDAEKIEIPNDLLERINLQVSHCVNNKTTLKESIANFMFPLSLNRFRKILAAVCCVILLSVSVLAVSKDARVFAMDSINKAITLVYGVVGYDNGEYIVKQVPLEESISRWSFSDNVFYSDEYIEKDVGFPIIFPEALPGGYNSPQWGRNIFALEDEKGNRDYVVSTIYPSETNTASGIVLEIAKSRDNQFFRKVYNAKSYKIGDKEVVWCESPYPQYPGNDLRQKPVNIDIIHFLLWENNGACYRLWRTNNDLTVDEALELAESIIHNKCPKNQGFRFFGKKYTKNELSDKEIMNQTGLDIRLPDTLSCGFSLESKTVSTLVENENSGHIIGAYYKAGDRHLKITVMRAYGDTHFLGSDAKSLNMDNMEYYWYEEPDTTNGLANKYNIIWWRSGGADYSMEVLDGSFKSMEEAAEIAKSVIGKR